MGAVTRPDCIHLAVAADPAIHQVKQSLPVFLIQQWQQQTANRAVHLATSVGEKRMQSCAQQQVCDSQVNTQSAFLVAARISGT